MHPLAAPVLAGDLRALARAATHIENRTGEAERLLRDLFPHTGRALIAGITGPPGAGKSTLVDQLAVQLRARGQQVGILAVDPSSAFTGGAILGDRIRMQQHHADAGVFIRSMAARGALGGLAAATLDLALLLDAAGREVVLVETVGVGQDEIEIARFADVTVVVLVPGMGDDVQAIKAGLMEIAEVFVLNKCDLPGADRLEREVHAMLAISPQQKDVPVLRVTATSGDGVGAVLDAVLAHKAGRRRDLTGLWILRLTELLRERFLQRVPAEEIEAAARRVAERRQDPYAAAAELLSRY